MARKLQTPVFYNQGVRDVDRVIRWLCDDSRVTQAERKKAVEAATVLMNIMVVAQARGRDGNA